MARTIIIGAGPVGLEAALRGVELGHDVQLFERGRVGQNMRDWGHVRLFSPWKLNHSRRGAELLTRAGQPLPGDEECLTGDEHVRRYLEPLAAAPALQGRIHERSRVVLVGRERIGKNDLVGGPRERFPLRVLVDTPEGERSFQADVVIDCSGTYGNALWMGNGNLPALGERAAREKIAYTLRDIAGVDRPDYERRHVLLVGDGQSAATALDALLELEGTTVSWVARSDRERPHALIPDDPLPERARLSRRANDLAAGGDPRVRFFRATTVERLDPRGERFEVLLRNADGEHTVEADRILAHVGYAPDRSIYRELQVHECYASSGPMKLAATLLDDTTADCLAQQSAGPETLRNPEPGFFILGAKSYGRHSRFLIQLGLQQIEELFGLIDKPSAPADPGAS